MYMYICNLGSNIHVYKHNIASKTLYISQMDCTFARVSDKFLHYTLKRYLQSKVLFLFIPWSKKPLRLKLNMIRLSAQEYKAYSDNVQIF